MEEAISTPKLKRKEHIKRTKLADRKLPTYTRGEEIFNMISHIVGGVFGVAALILCIVTAAFHGNVYCIASGIAYGVSMILLYTMSSVYHSFIPERAKKVMQIVDHCTIYILITGTYIPILLTRLRSANPVLAWAVFGISIGASALGIALNAVDLHKFRVISMVLYMTIGWSVIFLMKPLLACYSAAFFFWLFAGGLAYMLGCIFYGLGSTGKHPYCHSVFHLFVLAGSIIQFVGILKYCMVL